MEDYIIQNGHLYDIASASEIERSGIKLGEMNVKLLQKIEELTLYLIIQQKKIEKLEIQKIQIKKVQERLLQLEMKVVKI